MVPLGESVKDEIPSDKLQGNDTSNVESHVSNETPVNGVSTPQPDKKGSRQSVKAKKAEPVPDPATDASHLNQREKASPREPKKALEISTPASLALQAVQEVSTPSSVREKVSEDGYNWRKYGQKLVKGNEYVRSYYRCTHPNCLVKKQLERSHEGQIVDIVYVGQHAHSKPQVNIPVAVGFAVSIVEERRKEPSSTGAGDTAVYEQSPRTPLTKPVNISQISNASANDNSKAAIPQSNKSKDEVFNDDDPDSKRQKKDKDNLKSIAVDKPTSEPRRVIQTRSEVDIVNDGYRWRKYGQKLVKGNPNPRSYYRCSNSGCPVKKHVERASHDPKVVITTYEGQHSHNMPPSRIVTYNLSGSSTSPTAHNGESGTKSDGNAACLDMVVDAILEHESKSEQQNSDVPSRSAANDTKPDNQQNSKLVVKEESEPVISIPIESRT